MLITPLEEKMLSSLNASFNYTRNTEADPPNAKKTKSITTMWWWLGNSLPSATVGSNLRQVWCINLLVEETLCYNSNCRMPGPFKGL